MPTLPENTAPLGAKPKVSVIIPVRNEILRIRQCIEGILRQTVSVHEIIVIDSGSTDGTLNVLKSFPEVTVIQIDSATFNHGLTRNLGVEASSGEFCLLTVGDAYAYDEQWIQHLLDGFLDDEVLAVCGQQVVDHLPENNPLQWFRPHSEPCIKRLQFSASQWKALSPAEKRDATGWDDVNAIYRREALINQPFEKTSYSEDAIWAFNTLEKGHAIAYNQRGRVYHYHNEDADFAFKRALTSYYFRYKLTGAKPKSQTKSIRTLLSPFYQLFVKWNGSWKSKMNWWAYNQSRSRAFKRANAMFYAQLQQGEKALDDYHAQVCGKPPIPKKGV
jgi:rhamnosyltransferase